MLRIFLHLFTSPSPPFLTPPISFGFRFGIPRVLGNSFLGRLMDSGCQGHHQQQQLRSFFCFGIPRVLGNSFLGRLKESGLQARAGRCRGRAPKLKTKMRSESSASKKKVPSCDYRAPPPPKRNEKTLENIAEAACKHISYKSVGHRTACLADIWKSYTDRRLENASGTKRLALSRETFFLRIVDFHTLPGETLRFCNVFYILRGPPPPAPSLPSS